MMKVMKSDALSRELCKAYCQYYRPSKEEDLECMGFTVTEKLFVRGLAVSSSVLPAPSADKGSPVMPGDETIEVLISRICTICPFHEDDCDFIDAHKPGASDIQQARAIPCGGFLFLGSLIDNKIIDIQDINQVI